MSVILTPLAILPFSMLLYLHLKPLATHGHNFCLLKEMASKGLSGGPFNAHGHGTFPVVLISSPVGLNEGRGGGGGIFVADTVNTSSTAPL